MKERLKCVASGASLGTVLAGLTTQAGFGTVFATISLGSSVVLASVAVAPVVILGSVAVGLIVGSEDD
ncbi:MAG: hypothetical protein WBA39_34655 [Rivularia sp. (in: cyanobacteria)]